ncbi:MULTISPECIES: hypothetical protein [unclassified Microcoleus]|uniref:hypothetical protein n=1 Tax=unclassified Microcoleus TaxID=2642155 RepID=UPI0025ECFA69|nr:MULTISPECIES: hypothetical protein [unclassified Microcoleus]
MARKIVLCLLAGVALVWAMCWLLDFSVSQWLRISVPQLQALLVSGLAMLLIGMGVFLCS